MRHTPPNPQDNFRLMLAVAISLAIMLGFHFFYEKPMQEKVLAAQKAQQALQKPAAPVAQQPQDKTRTEALNGTRRIPIEGKKLKGSVSMTGGRIDDLMLNDYYATVENKEHVALLSPSGTKDAYYVESGWVSDDKTAVPDSKTVWSLAPGSAPTLVSGGAVTLQWDNGQGLVFRRKIELDDNYLFKVTQTITNNTSVEKKFNAYHLVSRHSLPVDFKGFFILHEGPLGYLGGKLRDPQYKDLNEGEKLELENTQGWLGITDKYWFVGILPEAKEHFNASITGNKMGDRHTYQTDIVTEVQTVQPGKSIEDKKYVFAGAKSLPLMNAYQGTYGFEHLDLTFDFGMWYFITKPFFFLFHTLMTIFGNVGLAILAMTVIVRAAVFPLASKSFKSMAGMKKIAPRLKELQEKYGKDREKLQMEIFELYKKEGVNPFSGCWPVLVQIPIFFALYKVILMSVELRHTPFWGWIRDLSAPDPTNVFNLFGLIPWTPPALFHIGLWPILFCITMILQKRLTPPMPDKMQEQLQAWFPYIITVMLANFASGLVIYWTWSNVLGVLQQYFIMRKIGGEDVSLVRGHSQRRKPKKTGKHG